MSRLSQRIENLERGFRALRLQSANPNFSMFPVLGGQRAVRGKREDPAPEPEIPVAWGVDVEFSWEFSETQTVKNILLWTDPPTETTETNSVTVSRSGTGHYDSFPFNWIYQDPENYPYAPSVTDASAFGLGVRADATWGLRIKISDTPTGSWLSELQLKNFGFVRYSEQEGVEVAFPRTGETAEDPHPANQFYLSAYENHGGPGILYDLGLALLPVEPWKTLAEFRSGFSLEEKTESFSWIGTFINGGANFGEENHVTWEVSVSSFNISFPSLYIYPTYDSVPPFIWEPL